MRKSAASKTQGRGVLSVSNQQ